VAVTYGYIPGNAIVKVDYDPDDSVAAGFREDDYAFVYRSVWFTDWDDMDVSARLDSGAFLLSGFWEDWETSGANGMPVIVHGENGDARKKLLNFSRRLRDGGMSPSK
jgi:hypothetical protein